jgi:alpha-L-fucosidase
LNIGWNQDLDGSDIVFYENGAGQQLENGFHGPGILCQKLTRTWFWRADDPVTACSSTDWAANFMDQCCSVNVNFMLNLSPNIHGQVDDNLADTLADFGNKIKIPAPLDQIPDGWMTRKQKI